MINNLSETNGNYRLMFSIAFETLCITHAVNGEVALLTLILSGLLLLSGAFRSCPILYYTHKYTKQPH